MSTATPTSREEDGGVTTEAVSAIQSMGTFRVTALVAVASLTATYVWKLHEITLVDGGGLFLPVVAVTFVLSTVLARSIDERTAAIIAGVLAVLGYAYYVVAVDAGLSLLLGQIDRVVGDTVALLTGFSLRRIARVDIWALGFAPGPVFLSWYLAVRRNYLAGTLVGGGALLFLVLTSDAGIGLTLAGMLAGIAAVGFGELDRRGGTLLQADVLVVLVALITVASLTLTLIPAGAASPLRLGSIGGGTSTVEGTFVGTPGQMEIMGSIELSPKVRFTVKSEQERYWRTGAYDRFDGSTWYRKGDSSPYSEDVLDSPPGPRELVVQTYTAETAVKTMPAAAEPVEVIGDATRNTEVTELDTILPSQSLIPGDKYRVRSMVLNATDEELRNASTDYPQRIEQRYLELPASTSDRFREVTANLTAQAENPYEKAKIIESYLQRTKNYSLDIDKPSGNIANKFLLEMDAGYCTYFATTMATMLRSEGIPARVAVGYTSGQQIDDDEWVVRGLDSHVWVEAYFPEYGWVRFDPTPAGPRESLETQRLEEARQGNGSGDAPIDTGGSEDVPLTTTTTAAVPNGTPNGTVGNPGQFTIPGVNTRNQAPNVTGNGGGGGQGGSGGIPSLPSGRDTAIGTVLFLGLTAGAHRVGASEKVYRAARLRWQGSRDTPRSDVERAYERLEMLLARTYRDRRPGETHREYVADLSKRNLDDRVLEVADIHERARYAGSIDQESADRAVELVDAMVRERTPVIGALRRRFGS